MTSAAEIAPEIRVKIVGDFVREYMDCEVNERLADVLNPVTPSDEAAAITIIYEMNVESLIGFFKTWADHQ
jgi:hypothetical protein